MRLRQQAPDDDLCAELHDALDRYRRSRRFDPAHYLDAKVAVLGDYFDAAGLHTAVVALSGGVDSAVVTGICARAAAAGRISGVVAVTAPVHDQVAATHQDDAVDRAVATCAHLGVELTTIDVTAAHAQVRDLVTTAVGIDADPWASGQLAALVRTPTFYMVNTLLTSVGRPAVLCGTTNRDEGAYLGFVGKASDGMVDLQLISDLHKSEVFALAAELGLPASVIDAEPNGDMYDGRPDIDVFGAPYDFVELYLAWRCARRADQQRFVDGLSCAARAQWDAWSAALERLHALNAHKYLVGSPAVHLDVMDSAVPGGWDQPRQLDITRPPATTAAMHGWFDAPAELRERLTDAATGTCFDIRPVVGTPAVHVGELLEPGEVDALAAAAWSGPWQPSGPDGSRTAADAAVSWRRTAWLPELASLLDSRLAAAVEPFVDGSGATFVHDAEGGVWRAVGVSPLIRFIRYDDGGHLVCHTDSPYLAAPGLQSLLSVVIYLDGPEATTRFVTSDAAAAHVATGAAGPLDDWDRCAAVDEVAASVAPGIGGGLVFPHRTHHDAPPVRGTKLIIRTDIMFARCGPGGPR